MTARSEPLAAMPAAGRDVRLDFFRGIGMLIIFLAHAPGNPWNSWIPARFGFSSATELFVFCSGFASALAFGMTFERRGFAMGAAKTAKRMWEVYWAHIGLFVALAALAVLVKKAGLGTDYFDEHIQPLMEDAGGAVFGLVTLTWLPAYLDILPMYLVILGLMPVVMLARRLHDLLPFALVIALYGAVFAFGINLPGNPWNGYGWFFNPFAWQLIFFTGFAFGMGWIPPPPLNRRGLAAACLAVVIVAVPLSFWGFHQVWPAIGVLHEMILPGEGKTDFHPLRMIHFLATAYIALGLIAYFKPDLTARGGHHIIKVGQQSLASFLLSLVVARLAGVALDMTGREPFATALINLTGLAAIILGAWCVGWFKGKPWNHRGARNRAHEGVTSVTPDAAGRTAVRHPEFDRQEHATWPDALTPAAPPRP
jgi:hypothetical protein